MRKGCGMMSEIEKLYENAGIKKLLYCDICKAQEHALGLCAETKCEPFYPPFTAEKQLELIKWLTNKFYFFNIEYENDEFSCSNGILSGFKHKKLRESLVDYINTLWQDLTDTEKAEIKRILE